MDDTNCIGRQHFKVKTDEGKADIREILDKTCIEEFS